MAAQVLSGSGNITYTNSTGQNVRIVINYLQTAGSGSATMSFQGVSISLSPGTIVGKNIWENVKTSNNYVNPIPLEFALSNGETFSITHATSTSVQGYNFIIIPEAG